MMHGSTSCKAFARKKRPDDAAMGRSSQARMHSSTSCGRRSQVRTGPLWTIELGRSMAVCLVELEAKVAAEADEMQKLFLTSKLQATRARMLIPAHLHAHACAQTHHACACPSHRTRRNVQFSSGRASNCRPLTQPASMPPPAAASRSLLARSKRFDLSSESTH